MQALETQISAAQSVFERVHAEEQSRSELIELSDIVEEDPYRSLRTEVRDIDQLAEKIGQRGQLVPILVWLRRGQYVLLSGHRRVAALRSLGARVAKAIVYNDRDLSARDALDIAIDDNVDRNNFTKLDLAKLVDRMVADGMTQRKIGKRLRLSNGSVSDYFRLASAPVDVQKAVDAGRLAIRAGLLLAKQTEAERTQVLADTGGGLLSLGDVRRRLAALEIAAATDETDAEPVPVATPAPPPRTRARRGAAWSRPTALVTGLAWQREREGSRELRVVVPADITAEQRIELRKLLLDQVRSLGSTPG